MTALYSADSNSLSRWRRQNDSFSNKGTSFFTQFSVVNSFCCAYSLNLFSQRSKSLFLRNFSSNCCWSGQNLEPYGKTHFQQLTSDTTVVLVVTRVLWWGWKACYLPNPIGICLPICTLRQPWMCHLVTMFYYCRKEQHT